jgi:hypothetical protein
MSQAKVDKYKQEKYNRKHNQKKNHAKKYLAYAGVTLFALVCVVYLGYSVAVETGIYTPPTTPITKTEAEIQSLRQTLIDSGDSNVKNVETTVAADAQTIAVDATGVEEETKADKKSKKTSEEETTVEETTEAE